jgi:FMN-dependent oxidoreductase (nitrilotriacetate monooxygenase family)
MSAIAALGAIQPHRSGLDLHDFLQQPYNVAAASSRSTISAAARAGWNLVTSQAEDEAVNFGRDQHFEHGIRYDRASGSDVVIGLWDNGRTMPSCATRKSGVWFDFDKMHILRHKGKHFTVRGPLNVARSPQGRPVVAQAGSSDVGMELAARTADMVFTAQTTIKEGQDFCNEMRSRVVKYGRGPEDIRIFPGIMPIVGRSETEAREKYEELRSLVDDGVGIAGVARLAGGVDIFACDPDGPLPELKPSNAARARQEMIIAMGKRGMTIREIGRVLAMSQAHRVLYGTPKQLADDMQEWLEAGACDGFNLLFPHYPKPLEEWVTMVVPELQRRGIFRTEYEGKTFRENLGVPIPPNIHTSNRTSVQVKAAAAND